MKRLANILEIVFLLGMLFLCGMIVMAGKGKAPYIFGYRVLQVISDSMKPTIPDRTCIMIKKADQEEIKCGDIITFVSEESEIRGFLNTHRVYDIVEDSETGEQLYLTKGDAHSEPDDLPVRYEQIAGKYVCELPFGKWIYKGIRLLADQTNYFIIVILPLLFCCLSYFRQLVKAIFGKEKDAS